MNLIVVILVVFLLLSLFGGGYGYAHRAPLAFKAIMSLPQPRAFSALAKGFDDECPCCRRPFADKS